MVLDEAPHSAPPAPPTDDQLARGKQAVKAMCALKFCHLTGAIFDPFKYKEEEEDDDDEKEDSIDEVRT